MKTQWEIHEFTGIHLSLKYTSLPFFEAWRSCENKGELEDKLRTMETAALIEWTDKRQSNGK